MTFGEYMYRKIDDMVWPQPGEKMNDIEWKLRHGAATKDELMAAASIISAYRQLIADPQKKRNMVIRVLRSPNKFNGLEGCLRRINGVRQ